MVVKSKGNPWKFQGNLGWWNIIFWPDTIRGTGIFIPTTWMADLYGFHVGKYSSPMDGMVDDPEESKKKYLDVPGNQSKG